MFRLTLSTFLLLSCLSTALAAYPQRPKQITDRPVIGILSLPLESDFPPTNATSYIAGSYVDWVESGGAQVVPLRVDHSWAELEAVFWNLNGVLFTGGAADFWDFSNDVWPPLTNYTKTGCFLYNLVKQANAKGIYMPIWGSCLGFELLHLCEYQSIATLPNFVGDPAYTQRHNFTEAGKKSRLFKGRFGAYIRKLLSNEFISILSHGHGVAPKEYREFKNLSDAFTPLATSRDRVGDEFVSIIEGVKYPIYASQFHPEKNLFEWDPAIPINHNQEAALMSTYLAQFFISEARRNANSFPAEELTPLLIYNWSPYFFDDHLYQLYFLN